MQPYNFGGERIFIPGPYVNAQFPIQPSGAGQAGKVVAIMATGQGGVPYNATVSEELKKNTISSISQARGLIGGGDAYYLTEFFLTPTNDPVLNPPSQVYVFRIDPSTQASAIIKDSGDINNIIDLLSGRYGSSANYVQYKIETGTNVGYRVSVSFMGKPIIDAKDDVSYEFFDIQYVGVGSAATMTINGTTLTTTVTGGGPNDNLLINLSEVKTLGDLVSTINNHEAYNCSIKEDSGFQSVYLDVVTGVDIFTTYTAYANTQAVIDILNLESNGEIIAELSTGAIRSPLFINASFVSLSGAVDNAASTNDWQNAFALLEQDEYSDIDDIIVGSSDPVVHALASDHCIEMSKLKVKKERRFLTGAGLTKSLSQRISESVSLNTTNGEYMYSKFQRIDKLNNSLEWFAPYYLAAIVAGIRANNNITMSATFKAANVSGIESFTDQEKESIIKYGGTYLTKVGSQFQVGHNVTTYQGNEVIFRIPSAQETVNFLKKDIRQQVQSRLSLMTRAPNALMVSDLETWINSVLLPGYRDDGGYITDNPNTGESAFTPVTVVLDGETFSIETTLTIVVALHYGFITTAFQTVGTR